MKSFHRRTARPAPHPVHHEAVPVERHGLARIDSLLVEKGLAPSRTVAQRMIAGGRVRVDGETVAKASQAVADSVSLEIIANEEDRFVSRGGLKLAGALAHSGIDPRGMQCLDVGQSTGGFSDCLLQAGAAKVVGVEVGHDQLHPRLRSDPRVLCLEALNARGLTAGDLGEAMPASGFELIVCDASFISLALLMPQWPALLAPAARSWLWSNHSSKSARADLPKAASYVMPRALPKSKRVSAKPPRRPVSRWSISSTARSPAATATANFSSTPPTWAADS